MNYTADIPSDMSGATAADRDLLYWFDVMLVGCVVSAAFLPLNTVFYLAAFATALPLVFSARPGMVSRDDLAVFGLFFAMFPVFSFAVWFHGFSDRGSIGGGVNSSETWMDFGLLGVVLFARVMLMRQVFQVLRLVLPVALTAVFVGLTVDKLSAFAGDDCRITGLTKLPFTPAILFGSFAFFYFALWQRLSERERVYAIALAFSSVVIAFGYTSARGALVGLLLGWLLILGCLARFRPPQWRLGVFGLLGSIILACLASVALDAVLGCSSASRLGKLAEVLGGTAPESAGPIGQRLIFWSIGWEAFTNAPLLGAGPGYEKFILGDTHHDHVHQQYLSWLIWFGIPGLLAGLAFLAFPVLAIWQRARGFERWAMIAAAASCLPVDLLFDSLMRLETYVCFQVLFGGFVFAYSRDLERFNLSADVSLDRGGSLSVGEPDVILTKGI
ncbi:MAG: hypothetical protein GY717_16395 [Rhodobacteraceae bacterium]|nr:hypothetical protein [Paracoccaceae bacterium]